MGKNKAHLCPAPFLQQGMTEVPRPYPGSASAQLHAKLPRFLAQLLLHLVDLPGRSQVWIASKGVELPKAQSGESLWRPRSSRTHGFLSNFSKLHSAIPNCDLLQDPRVTSTSPTWTWLTETRLP